MSSDPGLPVAHPSVLGADLDVAIDAPGEAESVRRAVLGEVERLNTVLNTLDPRSEFSRWRRGEIEDAQLSGDLAQVLAASERFWVFSRGAFPSAGTELVERWRRAEREGVPPHPADLRALARRLELPYTAVDGRVRRTGDCSKLDLGSYARGFILDAALDAGWRLGGARSIALGAADQRICRGEGVLRVSLTDSIGGEQLRLEVLNLADAAVSVARVSPGGFEIGGRRYRDTLDPQTGWPTDEVVGVAALASNAITAAALANIVRVGRAPHNDGLPGCAWLLVRADGRVRRSASWPQVGRSTSSPTAAGIL